jgi:hypothetical protein
MTPGPAPENATVAGRPAGYAGFADAQKRGTCPEGEADAGPAPGVSAEAPAVDAALSRFPEGDVGFSVFADARKSAGCPDGGAAVGAYAGDSAGAGPEEDVGFSGFSGPQRKGACPDCGADLEVYSGTNKFKLGTGFCPPCGRRVRLYREPVRTALRVVHGARSASAELRALLGG